MGPRPGDLGPNRGTRNSLPGAMLVGGHQEVKRAVRYVLAISLSRSTIKVAP